MHIKQFIKNSCLYSSLKKYQTIYNRKVRTSYHGKFIDRSKGKEKMCMVLAGYKEFLYSVTFARLKKYLSDDIDVCIITSGKWSDEISDMCEKNDWSYLSTKENDVSLVQNVAILKHQNARYIFKLDEDIFITENYFKKMYDAYLRATNENYNPGVITPLIPINGFGYLNILKKINVVDEYEKRFGKAKYGSTLIQSSFEVAKFMWGEDGVVDSIDILNKKFEQSNDIIPCPIRFSIGAILFERTLWEDMNYFRVVRGTNSLGVDEADICTYCCLNSRPLMVTENTVVGHLSFGPQNKEMKKYFEEHPDLFNIKEYK
jgi:hypothetical protein